MDALQIQTSFTFAAPQLAKFNAGLGAKFAPQNFGINNRYTLGNTAETESNEVLALKLFIAPEGSEFTDITNGSEKNPVDELLRIATAKEVYFGLLRANPDDNSDCPDQVTLTLSDGFAKALGFSAGPLTKTLKKGEFVAFSCPAGNTVAAGSRFTIVNNDTMLNATVMLFCSGFKV